MIEHHYTIIYNSTNNCWYLDDQEVGFPDGTIYDTSTGRFFFPDPDNPEQDEIVENDLNALTVVNNFIGRLNESNSTAW